MLNKYYNIKCGPVRAVHQLQLCREVKLPKRVSWYDTKQSDGEASFILELWGMRSTPSSPSLPGPL